MTIKLVMMAVMYGAILLAPRVFRNTKANTAAQPGQTFALAAKV
jgi:hypothetical protein